MHLFTLVVNLRDLVLNIFKLYEITLLSVVDFLLGNVLSSTMSKTEYDAL